MINIYIHVALMGNVQDVLKKLLIQIQKCDLYTVANNITLCLNGDSNNFILPILDPQNKIRLLHLTNKLDSYEFPTLNLLWEEAKNSEHQILYIHTKGVSKSKNIYVKDWVRYLSYFNISLWRERINDLRTHDCVGVNIKGSQENSIYHASEWFTKGSPLHYSGNFWWANSNYIRKLPDPFLYNTERPEMLRYYCEMWLLQLKGKFHCSWQSGVRHHKNEPYPGWMYKKNKINKFLKYILSPFFRLYIIFKRKT